MNAASELLFGFLALQNDSVSRENLISGVQIWLQDKSRSLADILKERRCIDPDECELLRRLTEKHLQRHGNDPQKSLASLASHVHLGNELSKLDDRDLNASICGIEVGNNGIPWSDLLSTLARTQSIDAHDSTSAPTNLPPARFQILRPHAKGGLGEVFIAKDKELNREVAVKEIQERFASNLDSRARFLLEAEITGGLEHPGIVPVYALGHYSNGRPYYAMRFIKGDSLKDAIDSFHAAASSRRPKENDAATESNSSSSNGPDYDGLDFRKLIGRFVDVCQAISYAHSRGVLHRDLKPGNIMLGKYGETLVVDWGLAKVRSRDEATSTIDETTLAPTSGSGVTPTVIGSAIGTPAYMPPEQAAGKLIEFGPASDVYSLGATLYHLLTGQPPFRGQDVVTVLQDVQAGRFPAPRSIQPGTSKSLEAVCLKAMSLKPEDRYSSPQQLADDIERYLADESVSACQDPLRVRARRWLRKHQTLTATTAAVVLIGLVSLGVFSVVVSEKNDALLAANARERDARTLAETNEQTAREQSQLALSTLTSVIQDIQGGLQNVPGSGEVRRRLLATSLEKLEAVSAQFLSQASVDRSTILALNEMGDVIMTFGTGNVSRPATGLDPSLLTGDATSAVELAASYYQRAFAIANTLAEDDPGNSAKQRDLSNSFERLGEVFLWLGRTSDTMKQFNEALRISRKLAIADPRNAAVQGDVAHSCGRLGDVLLRIGKTNDALTYYREALMIRRELSSVEGRDGQQQRELSISLSHLADVLLMVGQTDDALSHFKESLEIFRKLAEQAPGDAAKQEELSIGYDRLGTVFLGLGQNEAALVQFENATKISLSLVEGDPNNLRIQRGLSVSYQNLGDALFRLGRTESSLVHYKKSLEILQQLAVADSDNAQLQFDMAKQTTKVGDALWFLTQTEDALQQFREAVRISRNVAESDKTDVQKQRFLSVALEHLGDILKAIGSIDEARLQFEESLVIRLAVEESDQSNIERQVDISHSYERLGDVSLAQGQANDALKFFDLKHEIDKHLVEIDPSDAMSHRNLSISHSRLGEVFLQLGQMHDALTQFQTSSAILQSRASSEPGDALRQRDLWASHYKLAQVRMARDEFSLAAKEYDTAIDILKKMIERQMNPQLATAELAMVEAESRAGSLTKTALGDWDGLIQVPAEALPLYLDIRGQQCCKRKRFADAEQAARKLIELTDADNGQLYNAACVFSLCAAAIQAEEGKELTPAQSTKRMQLLAEGIATLKLSVDQGWTDFAHMQQDSDLALLRELPEFKALIPIVEDNSRND